MSQEEIIAICLSIFSIGISALNVWMINKNKNL